MGGAVYVFKRRKTDAVWSSTQTSDGSLEHREERPAQQLLPGIPDEITLDLVTPKLPWRAFHVLSSVSPGWKRAIQSGQVYDARVRAEGTETLAVINSVITGATNALGLYSGTDKLVHKLPPIPNVRNGIPKLSQCISLDGKIYVIGGERELGEDPISSDGEYESDYGTPGLNNVYVLDLARQRPWEQCKSMRYARVHFGLGVLGGKIYVMGGESYTWGRAVTVSEVYDPLCNTWHQFDSTLNWRSHHQISTIGEELIIHGGYLSSHCEMKEAAYFLEIHGGYLSSHCEMKEAADFLEIYHAGKNAWREIIDFDTTRNVFTHQGRLHSIGWGNIFVYDRDEKAWTVRHSYSSFGMSVESSALVCGNELIITLCCGPFVQDLLCSIGFGTHAETVHWQRVKRSFRLTRNAKISSLQL